MDNLLEKLGLKYEDLNSVEKETLNSWMDALSKSQITLETVRTYISSMKDSVEQELTQIGHEKKQDIFLKARLRNYILLEAFLSTPERAKKAIEAQLQNFGKKI